jgi:transposase
VTELEAQLAVRDSRLEAAVAQLATRDAQLAAAQARLAVLAGQAGELRRQLAKDSSTSSKPPSPTARIRRSQGIGRCGADLGASQVSSRGRRPGRCASAIFPMSGWNASRWRAGPCGADLSDAAVTGVMRRQVFETAPAPPPVVTEYQVVARQCPGCETVTEGMTPAQVTSLVQYGPGVHARAALAVCAHHLPVARATKLMAAFTGVNVSAGFVAGVRGKAAAQLGPFTDRVRALLRAAGVLYADETPARAAGGLRYVHVACTEFLTPMHNGGRFTEDIDAGGVLPGYQGTIVRDGYAGYHHLSDAVHAWCGAHGLRPQGPV